MLFRASTLGQFAAAAAALGKGEVCAVFRRSFYLRCENRFVCVGDASLGRGPLNALVADFHTPPLGERVSLSTEAATLWTPPPHQPGKLDLGALRSARAPEEGLGCLVTGTHNPLAVHAQPALEALDRWLVGNSLAQETEALIGLGPGLTPSGDDYFGGVLIALQTIGRSSHAESLWRWLQPRLAQCTSALSAAHLAAAAAGQGHETLHDILNGSTQFARLDAVGHCSGWDALAGAVAVLKSY